MESKFYASSKLVQSAITDISKHAMLGYILFNYVDKNKWVDELKSCFGVDFVDNITDFNYSRGFTYCINENGLEVGVRTGQLYEYLFEHKVLDRLFIHISTLGPFVCFEYMQYQFIKNEDPSLHKNRQIDLKRIDAPRVEFRKFAESGIKKFCKNNNMVIVREKDLNIKLDGITLENAQSRSTIFNFFFDDDAIW